MAAAAFAATTTLVACLGGVFAVVADAFPWMTVLNPNTTEQARTAAASAAPVAIREANQTPAAKALAAVLDSTPRTLAAQGWVAADRTTNVTTVDVGFGCEAKDGISPAVSLTQNWVPDTTTSTGTRVFTLTAQGYPAGGGALAYTGLRDAVLACGSANWFTVTGLGVEAAEIDTGRASTLVWRRGDALMVATAALDGAATAVDTYAAVAREADQRLKQALVGVCANPTSGLSDATRSPFLNRDDYRGYGKTITVRRATTPVDQTAEYLAALDDIRILDETTISPSPLPILGTLPVLPAPAPTKGPTTLPSPVFSPTTPAIPTEPAKSRRVLKAQPDHVGPGCGWGFTGQQAPRFDSDAAKTQHAADIATAQEAMQNAWRAWQSARLAFFTQWETYLDSAQDYSTYAAEVAEVRAAWALIDEARAAYATALAAYEAAVEARERFQSDKKAAKRAYRDAKKACRNQPESRSQNRAGVALNDPSATPTSTPTATDSPTTGPSSEPSPTKDPEPTGPTMICPPPVPPILNQSAPTVPASPVPAKEAQLPTPTSTPTLG